MWGPVSVLARHAQRIASTARAMRKDFVLAAHECSLTVAGLRPAGRIDNRRSEPAKSRRCGAKGDRVACVDQMEVDGRRIDDPVHGHDEYSVISDEDGVLELRNADGSYDFMTVNEASGTAVTSITRARDTKRESMDSLEAPPNNALQS